VNCGVGHRITTSESPQPNAPLHQIWTKTSPMSQLSTQEPTPPPLSYHHTWATHSTQDTTPHVRQHTPFKPLYYMSHNTPHEPPPHTSHHSTRATTTYEPSHPAEDTTHPFLGPHTTWATTSAWVTTPTWATALHMSNSTPLESQHPNSMSHLPYMIYTTSHLSQNTPQKLQS
jgi:hypothetical protein